MERMPAIIMGMRADITELGLTTPMAAIAEPALAVPYAAPIPETQNNLSDEMIDILLDKAIANVTPACPRKGEYTGQVKGGISICRRSLVCL